MCHYQLYRRALRGFGQGPIGGLTRGTLFAFLSGVKGQGRRRGHAQGQGLQGAWTPEVKMDSSRCSVTILWAEDSKGAKFKFSLKEIHT